MKTEDFFQAYNRAGEAIETFNLSPIAGHLLTNGILRIWNERRRPSTFQASERSILGKTNLNHNSFLNARHNLVRNSLINYVPGERNVEAASYGLGSWFHANHEPNKGHHEPHPDSNDASNSDSNATSNQEPNPILKEKEELSDKGSSSVETQAIAWSATGGFSGITEEDKEEWEEAYPACDVPRQLAEMNQWLKSNPAKAKKKQWRRFVTGWLSRSQESGGDLRGKAQSHRTGKSPMTDFDTSGTWTPEQNEL